jgi:protein-S-isoprenylcysteine O-methyltransferase Ste14
MRTDPTAPAARSRPFSALLPSLMTIIGGVVFGGLWIFRVIAAGLDVHGILILAGGLVYVAWVLGEARVSIRELTAVGVTYDRNTLELAAIAKQLFLLAALLPATRPGLVNGLTGIAMIVLGGGFRILSIRRMGQRYTHRIRIPSDGVVDSGPYRLVRHPAYLGTLIGHAGIVVLLLSPWSLAALILAWLPIVVARTWIEDNVLRRELPDYRRYCSRIRWRLIPGVW